MRVKRLEVQGFKSFKDKTLIHFDKPITGIVGPNGCGKSNVVDAFFWVMGEQSNKHIRAGSSADLIFNGSSKYSPMNYAEATMVLETDYVDTANAPAGASVSDVPLHLRTKEISVTRRVYRSGEGEYFINGVQARLKDIHELFMDTGIGAKGYSIIAQGEIQKIVNSKPEDRRLLIEEAAGIAKYKARKKESLRKLEAAEGNLARLNDVVAEIERTLNSLERQAQKASQYKKLKDELLSKEMTWGRRKNKLLVARLSDLRGKREILEQELVGLRSELSTAENSIESDRVEQLTLSKQVEELQGEIQSASSELTRSQSALELSRRRQNDLANQLETLEAEKGDLGAAIANEREKIVGLESENDNAAQEFEAHAGRVSEQDDKARELRRKTDEARRGLDGVKRAFMAAIAENTDLTSRAAGLESKIESARAQIAKLTAQIEQLREKSAASGDELADVQARHAEAAERKSSLHAESRAKADEVQASEQELKAFRRELDDSHRALTKLKSRLQSLEELAAAHEGFGDGPKAILDWAKAQGRESSLRALADGIEIDAGFEAALEGHLEGKLENLASDDASLALAALRELRSGEDGAAKGRATVYVGASASGAMGASAGSADAVRARLEGAGIAVLGSLSRFVRSNASASDGERAIAAKILDGAIVVESLDGVDGFLAAHGLAGLEGHSLVARTGEALGSDGALRGGSVQSDNSASLLGRKRAIAELQEQVAEAEIAHAVRETREGELASAIEIAKAALSTLRSELQSAEIEAATLERDVQALGRGARENQSALELAEYELAEMTGEAESATTDKIEIEAKLATFAQSKDEFQARIESEEALLGQLEEHLRAEDALLSEVKIQEAQLRERANSIRRELEAGQNLIRDRERRLQDVERSLLRAQQENEEHSGGDSEHILKIEDLTKALSERREVYASLRDRLEVVSAKVSGALDRIKHLHSEGDSKTHTVTQYALELERTGADLQHLVQNLEEKYGPGCLEQPEVSPIQEEMEDPVVTTAMSVEEEKILGEDVERLRERIRRLGDVNPGAVEEYEEKKKRFDYLIQEKNDLLQSMENLKEAIEHINRTSVERFEKAFTAIADRFERLFPIIFGGGQAKLSLVYPEGSTDILESGVDILAQPPGKKIVNIGLLSGGEKALTAVSLIFAIFMVKPSPFCILDEVDAPLDDANIGKFNALLREMSQKSQFIVITHNKKTMELNDTLYGVTMEEPGVSKMVSVQLH